MNEGRLWAVIAKEWLELRQNKVLLGSMVALPLILILSVVGMAALTSLSTKPKPDEATETTEKTAATLEAEARLAEKKRAETEKLVADELKGLDPDVSVVVQMNDMMLFMLLLIPMILPTYMAAYSIIGEKETKSLEPLLATPLATSELLLGKTIAAALPAVLLGWGSYALAVALMFPLLDPLPFMFLVRPVWTLGIVLLSPVLAVLATLTGVVVSSRTTDPRVAQQLAGLITLPLIGLSTSVVLGWVFMSLTTLLWTAAAACALTLGLLWLAVRLFQREAILTRWR